MSLDREAKLREFAERRAARAQAEQERLNSLNSYERVIDILDGERVRLQRHAEWERYGDRDGPHPPMDPEEAAGYAQFLALRMEHALRGKYVPSNHYRATDEGWIYAPPE